MKSEPFMILQMLALLTVCGVVSAAPKTSNDAWPKNPKAGWDFRFKEFVIGAWWGPEAIDAEMAAYKDAGFNVVMLGRYMTTPDAKFNERAGTKELIQEQLDFCKKHDVWALIDTYTPDNKPWGGTSERFEGRRQTTGFHTATPLELEWLCKQFAAHPSTLGFMLGDDKSILDKRLVTLTGFLHKNHPDLMPWVCQNKQAAKSLARHGNPIYNLQIYPTLYRKKQSAKANALEYCSRYDRMRKESRKHNLIFWPMMNSCGFDSDSLMRFPIYAALAYGAQGYWIFTYDRDSALMAQGSLRTKEEVEAGKTPMWHIVKKANQRVLVWAPRVLGAKAINIYTTITGNVPAHQKPSAGNRVIKMDNNVLVGILKKEGSPLMAMIVDGNVAKGVNTAGKQEVNVTFDASVEEIVILADSKDGKHRKSSGNKLTIELEPGEGQLVLLKQAPVKQAEKNID